MSPQEPFDEANLRRALRLEADERPPVVSLATLQRSRPLLPGASAQWIAASACLGLGGLALGALLGDALGGVAALAPALLDIVILAMVEVVGNSELLFSPVTLVGTVVATFLYVQMSERGVDHVRAS